MFKAWLCIPSARRGVESSVSEWARQGYGVALFCDEESPEPDSFHLQIRAPYYGYANAVNRLVAQVAAADQGSLFFIAAGDDVQPDMARSADSIADECVAHFGGTFGVMQPVADRWGDREGAYIDRVAGSAWIGREFALRAYHGNGPLWPEYFHMGVDEELQAVATRLGVFWQRPDLIQLHRHWGRGPNNSIGNTSDRPAFLDRANSFAEWQKYKRIYAERAAANFPGSGL